MLKNSISDNIKKTPENVKQILKDNVLKELYLKYLPQDVSLSTITIIYNLDTDQKDMIDVKNIALYMDLSSDNIISVSHGRNLDALTNRSIDPIKKHPKKKKKQKKVFYNQVTIRVKILSKKKPVNVKIFSNGAIQMTGCKTIEDGLNALEKIFKEFKKVKAIIDYKNNKIVEKPFIKVPELASLMYIKNIKIAMINSGFKIKFKIDRNQLYNLLLDKKYECSFDPNVHACVNVKYDHSDKKIAIFIFEKGSIIITGAKNCKQIRDAYNFINELLYKNYSTIVKNDIMPTSIMKYVEEHDELNNKSKSFSRLIKN